MNHVSFVTFGIGSKGLPTLFGISALKPGAKYVKEMAVAYSRLKKRNWAPENMVCWDCGAPVELVGDLDGGAASA